MIFNNKTLLKDRLELDIYFPKLNKAIEYNGDYWHCNPNKYEADYFHKKSKLTAKEI
jgi:hypothetical protein